MRRAVRRWLNRKAIARYEFDRKMLSFLTEDEKERYAGVCMASDLATASFLEMRRLEAEMEARSGVMMSERP